jgi:hypothetical protein
MYIRPEKCLLAACWQEFNGDDGGMSGDKLLGRMEEVIWEPPTLSLTVERHVALDAEDKPDSMDYED